MPNALRFLLPHKTTWQHLDSPDQHLPSLPAVVRKEKITWQITLRTKFRNTICGWKALLHWRFSPVPGSLKVLFSAGLSSGHFTTRPVATGLQVSPLLLGSWGEVGCWNGPLDRVPASFFSVLCLNLLLFLLGSAEEWEYMSPSHSWLLVRERLARNVYYLHLLLCSTWGIYDCAIEGERQRSGVIQA